MSCRLSTCFLLALLLVPCRRTSSQTVGQTSNEEVLYPPTIPCRYCEPAAPDRSDQVMAVEEQNESIFRSTSPLAEIIIQKFNKDGKKRYAPGAVNSYQVVVEFGWKTKIRKIFTAEKWRRLWWRFNLGGFADMACLDPYHFDKLNYDFEFRGEETLLGQCYWVYHVTPKPMTKNWHFEGTIWVLPNRLTIIRFKGAFQPMHTVRWLFLVEDFRFSFDSWRKETVSGTWVPDFICTGVDVGSSDSIKPAFRGRIIYLDKYGGRSRAESGKVCEMAAGGLPAWEIPHARNPGVTHRQTRSDMTRMPRPALVGSTSCSLHFAGCETSRQIE
jgi:hypothetical protein